MMDTSQFCCPNEECPDYGKRGKGNIICNRRYGKQRTQLLKYKTCGKSFSENRGTPFFDLRTSKGKVVRALQTLAERGSLRGTARATGHKKDTISLWQKRAVKHADALREYLLYELDLDRVEVDELYTFEKKEKNIRGDEPDLDTIGETLIWRALKPETKLRLASHVGKDSAQEADILIGKIKRVSDDQSSLFVSDGRSYGQSLTKHCSTEVQPDPTKPKLRRPRKQPERRWDPDLLYGQAIKDKDSRGRVVGVRQRMVFGSVTELRKRFGETPLNQLLTTNHIERDHLTARLHNSRLVRHSITYSKLQAALQWQCDLEDLYYNFCLPHSSLRRELPEPIPTKGTDSPKKWAQRTPAMAEGIADHIITLAEVLSIPVLPQCHHNMRWP